MGFRTNQDSADWGRALLQSPSPEVATPQQPETLKCPRCASPNTKFCYYNNYNKSQPRHFCKSCKRHWTKGGTLRNVPVGGCRKNKRPKVSTAAAKSGAGAPNLCPSFANSGGDRKGGGVPNIFYQALIRSPNPSLNESMDGINISAAVPGKNSTSSDETKTKTNDSTGIIMNPAAPNSEFQFSNLGSGFEMNNPLIQSSYQPINTYEMGNMDSVEESTVTMEYPSMSGGGAWLGLESGNCSSMELANYWNWSELDALTSPDDLNISWDEEEEKVKP